MEIVINSKEAHFTLVLGRSNYKCVRVLIDQLNTHKKEVDQMARPRFDREEIFRYLVSEYVGKEKIKKKTGISEATYWRIKREFDLLDDSTRLWIRKTSEAELMSKWVKSQFIDYEFVQRWIVRMKSGRKPIKSWKRRFNACRRIWLILQKKNPQNWTLDDIELRVLPELRKTAKKSINGYLIALRSLRPDFKFPDEKGETLLTEPKPEPTFEWKKIYERMMSQNKLETFLSHGGFKPELLKRLHVILGCREGTKGVGGILGLEWNRVNWAKATIDVYEGKTGGGFYWLDCPLILFENRTFEMLKQYWIEQGKPTSGKIFGDVKYSNGKECDHKTLYLTDIYKESAEVIGEQYGREYITPHFARKLHASLLIDADVPLEMVAGDRPFGIFGVGWTDISTLKKYYLAFRKAKIDENRNKVRTLSF